MICYFKNKPARVWKLRIFGATLRENEIEDFGTTFKRVHNCALLRIDSIMSKRYFSKHCCNSH